MGLFGREDRSTDAKPPAQPAAPRTTPAAGARSGITVIAAGCRIDGVVSGSGDLLIEGRLSGEITGSAAITIAEGGSVEATVHGQTVVIAGRVRGDTSATDKIELAPSADVEGNITSPRILIREGATFEGQVFMKQPDAKQQRADKPVGGASSGAGDSAGAGAAPAGGRDKREPKESASRPRSSRDG